ncbi:MAG: MarR family transcriptional regulator [Bacteroidia bacterium]
MRLEDEIKTRQFRNQRQKLLLNILYTQGWLMSRQLEVLQRHEITSQQYNILRILRGQHPQPCNVALLKERMLDKQSDVSRLVDRLVKKGLIERTVSPHDRRNLNILISESGLELLSVMQPEVDASTDNLGISEEDAKTVNDLLDAMRG